MEEGGLMAKRSEFKRNPRDLYETTDLKAGRALADFLHPNEPFIEPCAGTGALVKNLQAAGFSCKGAYDIKPGDLGIGEVDARKFTRLHMNNANLIITNPPYTWTLCKQIIDRFMLIGVPAWLLLPLDWAVNERFAPVMHHVSEIVPIGRLKWITGSKHTAMDNSCWYFVQPHATPATIFHPRKKLKGTSNAQTTQN